MKSRVSQKIIRPIEIERRYDTLAQINRFSDRKLVGLRKAAGAESGGLGSMGLTIVDSRHND